MTDTHRSFRWPLAVLLGLAACASSGAEPVAPEGGIVGHPTPAAPPAPVIVATPPVATPPVGVVKDQPPQTKLRLGHYRNQALGIGVVIDLTETTENVADIDPAKVRFDGDDKLYRLVGAHGHRDRIDYRSGTRVVLRVWSDGRRSVTVFDPATETSSEDIAVTRDGDADPL